MSGWERGNPVIKGGRCEVEKERSVLPDDAKRPMDMDGGPWDGSRFHGGDQLETLRVGRRLGRAGWRKKGRTRTSRRERGGKARDRQRQRQTETRQDKTVKSSQEVAGTGP